MTERIREFLASWADAMRRRLILGPLVAALAVMRGSPPAGATVPQTGHGLGISDPDPIPANSMQRALRRAAAEPFRLIVDWNVVDDPALKEQVATRIARARAAGVREVAVAFGGPAGIRVARGLDREGGRVRRRVQSPR